MKENNTLYIVVPCYNEAEMLPISAPIFLKKIKDLIAAGVIGEKSKTVFVDDGSKDATWEYIAALCRHDSHFAGVKLSRNRGHQNALLAGLSAVADDCDMTVSIDADLQDDIHAIDEMVARYHEGYEVVYGVRSARETDTLFKRTTAEGFYKLMLSMGVDIVYNHADFRLLSRRALKGLLEFKEVNLFLRGMVPLVGYRSTSVTYARAERAAGESKYPLKKMLSFAFDGITSFSVKPIRLITSAGVLSLLGLFVYLIYLIVCACIGHPGDGRLAISLVWLFGSLNLIGLGVVGEYIGKIYMETKSRPRFLIETYLTDCADEEGNQ